MARQADPNSRIGVAKEILKRLGTDCKPDEFRAELAKAGLTVSEETKKGDGVLKSNAKKALEAEGWKAGGKGKAAPKPEATATPSETVAVVKSKATAGNSLFDVLDATEHLLTLVSPEEAKGLIDRLARR